MNIKTYLILASAVCVISQVSAFNFCNCKDRGIDVCSCKKGLTAPRPYPVRLPRIQKVLFNPICKEKSSSGYEPFKSIGDACNCGQQIVKPAPLPNIRPNVRISIFQYKFVVFKRLINIFQFSVKVSYQKFNYQSQSVHVIHARVSTKKNTQMKKIQETVGMQ